LHVDRERFDRRLYETAVDAGVEFVWDRIHTVQIDNDALTGCVTSSGGVRRAQWYIDAAESSAAQPTSAHTSGAVNASDCGHSESPR
jgi:flavin-dependent dehydrogenase